jgi:hypothetical protein
MKCTALSPQNIACNLKIEIRVIVQEAGRAELCGQYKEKEGSQSKAPQEDCLPAIR